VALETQQPFVWWPCERSVEGGLLYWGMQKKAWKRAFISIGAPLGDQRGDVVYRGL